MPKVTDAVCPGSACKPDKAKAPGRSTAPATVKLLVGTAAAGPAHVTSAASARAASQPPCFVMAASRRCRP